jgi:hypothetical protein
MRSLIRFTFAFLLLCVSSANVFAGSGSVKPVRVSLIQKNQIQKLDELLSKSRTILTDNNTSASPDRTEATGKICSCEILDMESLNYHHQQVVLLAEKTNHKGTADYDQAKRRIQKEKKNLKRQFYDKIKLVSEFEGTGTCKSLYFKLKSADSRLQLYEILNADVH